MAVSIAEIAIMRAKCLELAEELRRRATLDMNNARKLVLSEHADIMETAAAIFEREAT